MWVTVSVKEVTDEIAGGIDGRLGDAERGKLLERRVKQRTARCEKPGLRCTVASFFEGARWFEVGQLEIQDVRLVFAPPGDVGNFGGETDNWMWPRHSGDFALYRAYVGKDGKPPAAREGERPLPAEALPRRCHRGASPRASSCSWPGTRAAPSATRPIAR